MCTVFQYIGNAEMTELFKCRKSGTKCCAPKSMIREVMGFKEETPSGQTDSAIQHTSVVSQSSTTAHAILPSTFSSEYFIFPGSTAHVFYSYYVLRLHRSLKIHQHSPSVNI